MEASNADIIFMSRSLFCSYTIDRFMFLVLYERVFDIVLRFC